MISKPLVSIVIPVTKCAFLKEAIVSVDEQSYQNIELVVVDNKADGDVGSIVAESKIQNRIFHQRPEQLPALENWNDSVRRSSGELVLLLSDDDILLPYTIEKLVRRIEESGSTVAVGAVATINEAGKIQSISCSCPHLEHPSSWIYHRFTGQRTVVLSNYLFLRKSFDDVDGFDESGFAWGADNDLFVRLAMLSESIAGIDEVCLFYRLNGSNLSSVMASQSKAYGNDWLLEKIETEIEKGNFCLAPPLNRALMSDVFKESRRESSKGVIFELMPWHPFNAFKFFRARKGILSLPDFVLQSIFSLNSCSFRRRS